MLGILTLLIAGGLAETATIADNVLLDSADFVAYSVCHRLPSHSFQIFGRSMPLCARCSGIYLGIIMTLLVIVLGGRVRYAQYPPRRILLVLLLMVGAMAADGINSFAWDFGIPTPYTPHNTLRLITGFAAGISIAVVTAATFAQTVWKTAVWKPVLGTFRELAILWVLAIFLILLILSNFITVLYVLSIVSAVGVVIILMILYTTLLFIFTRQEFTITKSWQLIPAIMVGFGLATAQIVAIAMLRYNLTGVWHGF